MFNTSKIMFKVFLRDKYFLNHQFQKNFRAIQDRGIAPFSHCACKSPEFFVTTLQRSIVTFSPFTGFRPTLCGFYGLFHHQKTAGAIFSRPSAMSLLEHVCLKVLTVLNKSRHAFTGTLQGCVLP